MFRLLQAVLIVICSTMLSSCLTSKAYVDPQYRAATYDSIQRPSTPVPVRLEIEFQRNGKTFPAADEELRRHIVQTLIASGVYVPVNDPNVSATLDVTANNLTDLAGAGAKGFGTGLTLGAAGFVVEDDYEFEFVLRDNSKLQTQSVYQHAIHTAIGNAQGPVDSKPTSPAEAFRRVVEDVVLSFIKDQ